MGLQIRPKKRDSDDDAVMLISLVVENDGEVIIVGEDATGSEYFIATMGADGLTLHSEIDKDSGWPLDNNGKIKLVRTKD